MDTYQQNVRTWSMLCHISALAGLLFTGFNVLGPLIVWQIKKNELPEITPHGKASVNFQLTVLIINIILLFFVAGTVGFGVFYGNPFTAFSGLGLGALIALINLIAIVLTIIAGVRANNGELYRYPSIKFIR